MSAQSNAKRKKFLKNFSLVENITVLPWGAKKMFLGGTR